MDTDPPEESVPVDHDTNRDELLDDAAQGLNATADGEQGAEGTGEIDAIGNAAGFVVQDGKPFRGIEEVERRDQRRWELDPASADPDPAAVEAPEPSDGQDSIDPASAET